jgi:hypothetical protein
MPNRHDKTVGSARSNIEKETPRYGSANGLLIFPVLYDGFEKNLVGRGLSRYCVRCSPQHQ